MSLGDIGEGVAETLRKNEKHQHLSIRQALLTAFKWSASRWPDEAGRGKGLNDLLAIGKGNKAWVRIETNGVSLFFDFRKPPGKEVTLGRASTNTPGTRVSLVLIDSILTAVSRREIDTLIDRQLETLS